MREVNLGECSNRSRLYAKLNDGRDDGRNDEVDIGASYSTVNMKVMMVMMSVISLQKESEVWNVKRCKLGEMRG